MPSIPARNHILSQSTLWEVPEVHQEFIGRPRTPWELLRPNATHTKSNISDQETWKCADLRQTDFHLEGACASMSVGVQWIHQYGKTTSTGRPRSPRCPSWSIFWQNHGPTFSGGVKGRKTARPFFGVLAHSALLRISARSKSGGAVGGFPSIKMGRMGTPGLLENQWLGKVRKVRGYPPLRNGVAGRPTPTPPPQGTD